MTVGSRWRQPSTTVLASTRRLALVLALAVVSTVAAVPAPADASAWCDPASDPAGCLDEGSPATLTFGPGRGLDSMPPDILALVEEASANDRGDRIDPARLSVEEAVLVGAARLVLGIDALAELGAFRRDPDPDVNDAIRSIRQWIPADGLEADGFRSEIRSLDDDVSRLVAMIRPIGTVSQPLIEVDSAIGNADLQARLDAGETGLFEPDDWLSAAADLLLWTGTDPPPEERDGDLAVVLALASRMGGPLDDVAASTTAAPTVEPGPVAGAADEAIVSPEATDDRNGMPWPLLLVGVGVSLLGILAVGLRRTGARRGAPSTAQVGRPRSEPTALAGATDEPSTSTPTPTDVARAETPAVVAQASLEDLLDVSRRMTASLDEAEVAAIALAEAERLVEGEGGLLAAWDGSEFRTLCHRPSALFDLDALGDGSLQRVMETGRSIVQVTDDEPALVEVPMALAAIPVVAEGRVVGAILVVRVPANPFARRELDGLEMLAPLIGSALLAAETHGSATQLADIDPLSGLNNRRRLTADLAAGADRPLAAIMVDIDHFKTFNDTNGHAAGDEALRRVAMILADNVRPGDVVYRYGGEEFCVLLTDTSLAEAAAVAERARAAVEAADIPGGENQPAGRVTISVGLARSESGSHHEVIERADGALYQAKHGGRNRVITSSS